MWAVESAGIRFFIRCAQIDPDLSVGDWLVSIYSRKSAAIFISRSLQVFTYGHAQREFRRISCVSAVYQGCALGSIGPDRPTGEQKVGVHICSKFVETGYEKVGP